VIPCRDALTGSAHPVNGHDRRGRRVSVALKASNDAHCFGADAVARKEAARDTGRAIADDAGAGASGEE